ncbi:MAG: radical SAM family heme chaperone HemW [Bacteroidetes bacterium]|nr:radical SAM family heme chaperone HemW [Bacteroidota bacterium]
MAGLYIHIPFCKQACYYCDFHFSTNLQSMASVVDCIILELELRKDYLKGETVNTIYFGGGTPSLVPTEFLEKILDQIARLFPGKKQEVTLEANPDDLNPKALANWKSIGIDRLSLGIQSFQDEILQAYNRVHNSVEAKQAIQLARAAGFEKFSIDLIYGYPHSDHRLWHLDLEEALCLDPGHLSAYSLTIEPQTTFGNWAKKGKFSPAEEEFIAQQFEWLQEQCDKAGYIQYEISNFSRPDQAALHNSNYWKRSPYLGIGPSAHSFDGSARGFNPSSNPAYLKALTTGSLPFIIENLTTEERINEEILTSLRTLWGLDTASLAGRYQVDILEIKRHSIAKLTAIGMIYNKEKTLTLTRKGQLLADSIASEIFLDSHDLS